jgi:MoxR-like ATPase
VQSPAAAVAAAIMSSGLLGRPTRSPSALGFAQISAAAVSNGRVGERRLRPARTRDPRRQIVARPSDWKPQDAALSMRHPPPYTLRPIPAVRHRRSGPVLTLPCGSDAMRFSGTETYVATPDLTAAVNAAVVLERPLLVKGEPGTGKTVLAEEIAKGLGAPLIVWNIKSTTKAQQGLYEYDAVSRLRDSQLGDPRVSEISNYIRRGKLWEAFTAPERPVLLIDEVDKADIEFPNDLLTELDRMEFHVYETGETIAAVRRPIVIITSNNEKELPDAFLRRCFFHYIKFPDAQTLHAIVDVHYPGIKHRLVEEALRVFLETREVPGLKKKPSTSELLDWLKLLVSEDVSPETLRERDGRKLIPPLHGALLKNEQDVSLFEKLAFMMRREQRGG